MSNLDRALRDAGPGRAVLWIPGAGYMIVHYAPPLESDGGDTLKAATSRARVTRGRARLPLRTASKKGNP